MSSTSMISCNFSGMRVAGDLSYFPGYVKADGKHVDQRVIIPSYANFYSPDDTKKKSKPFDFIVWGRMAETLCRNLSPGREFTVMNAVADPYDSEQKHSNGQVALDMITGLPLKETTTTYKVDPDMFKFSNTESKKLVDQQKQTGERPLNWDNATHPDSLVWSQMKNLKNSEIWNGASEKFGYSKVFMPKGDGIKVDKMSEKAARTAKDVALATIPSGTPAPAAPALDMNMLAIMIDQVFEMREAAKAAKAAAASPSPSPFNSDYAAMGEPKSLFTEILSQLPAADSQTEDNLF